MIFSVLGLVESLAELLVLELHVFEFPPRNEHRSLRKLIANALTNLTYGHAISKRRLCFYSEFIPAVVRILSEAKNLAQVCHSRFICDLRERRQFKGFSLNRSVVRIRRRESGSRPAIDSLPHLLFYNLAIVCYSRLYGKCSPVYQRCRLSMSLFTCVAG